MNKECLRTGDKATVKFRFIKHPEYIKIGQRMVFREGRTKAVGNVLKPLPHTPASNANRTKPTKMQSRNTQGQQNQQNQNPNVGSVSSNDVKANLDTVLEMSTDKRNVKTRGGKRKRFNVSTQPSEMAESSSATQ